MSLEQKTNAQTCESSIMMTYTNGEGTNGIYFTVQKRAKQYQEITNKDCSSMGFYIAEVHLTRNIENCHKCAVYKKYVSLFRPSYSRVTLKFDRSKRDAAA